MRDKKQIIQDLYRALELQKAPESLYRISKNINYRSQNLGSLLELMEFIKELPPIKREKRGKITYLSIGSPQSKEKATAETIWEVWFENWTAKIQYSAVVEFWSFVKMEFQEELASSGLLDFASSFFSRRRIIMIHTMKLNPTKCLLPQQDYRVKKRLLAGKPPPK